LNILDFYCRDPVLVARALLGNILVRKIGLKILSGVIVETEAYYGSEDPASRAFKGMKNYNTPMFEKPGTLFIYMVHGWWLLNISAHREGEVGAVLIRALEPIDGIEYMMLNRGLDDLFALTSGPGKLTKSLGITKKLNGHDIVEGGEISVIDGWKHEFEVNSSYRIGVTHDLPKHFRFYVSGNSFVSR